MKIKSELQNERPASSSHSYIQPSIFPEPSNPSEPQLSQPAQ